MLPLPSQRPTPSASAAPSLVAWATAGAACAALAQLAEVWRRQMVDQFTWIGRDVWWMSPAGNAILFGALAVALAIAGRTTPVLASGRLRAFVFALLTALSMLLLFSQIWQYASLVLAIGVAVVVARATGSHSVEMRRVVHRLALGAGSVALAIAMIAFVRRDAGIVDTAGRSAAATRPNVLVLLLDTVRAASLSLYGYERETSPELVALARSSIVFDRAIATAPWTLPSHCSLFTGLYVHELPCGWEQPLDGQAPTLAEAMVANGYRTAGFVANPYYTTVETGLARGFDEWHDFRRSLKEIVASTRLTNTGIARSLLWGNTIKDRVRGALRFQLAVGGDHEHDRKSAGMVNEEFLRWQAREAQRPFFAFLNYFDAHEPYEAPPPYDERFSPAPNDRHIYEGAIASIDGSIGSLLRELERRGVLENTIVLITSDHGEEFGERGVFGHGMSLNLRSLHVPLVVRFPRSLPGGVRVPNVVTLRDVATTLLDIAGIPNDRHLGGTSLRPLWEGRDSPASSVALAKVQQSDKWGPRAPASHDSLQAIVNDRFHYIRSFKGVEELFEYQLDSLESRDLAPSANSSAQLLVLRELLSRMTAGCRTRADC